MKINFNEPILCQRGLDYINEAITINKRLNGDGPFTKICSSWFEQRFAAKRVLLTTSCTHALEMAALLCEIKEGDEVIMPSFTFVSTADAFVLRGARIKFVDIRPDTLNIDEKLIETAVTEKTRAIVPVHYAGVSCEMDTILEIARKYNLFVVEDAAQGVMAKYKGRYLGTIGDFGTYSFHETKNYTMGEGGAIVVNEKERKSSVKKVRTVPSFSAVR
jgi:dTDP-4-amino-4,6-dideoxygalactose transaminase